MNRRGALAFLGAAATSSLAGCATVAQRLDGYRSTSIPDGAKAYGASGSDGGTTAAPEFDVKPVSGPITKASIPVSARSETYAVMGTEDAPTLTLFGSWKCPYTREFVINDFGRIVEEYVDGGDVSIRFRSYAYDNGTPFLGPDAPRASWAGVSVWNHAPQEFWRYFATVFANQPPERYHWATLAQIRGFLQAADVPDESSIADDIHAGKNDERVRATTTAVNELGIDTVPRLVYDGTVVAPNLDPERTDRLLRRAADDG